MNTHKAKVGFISRTQKTAKTECGATVKVSAIAIDRDCTCVGCREAVDKHWRAAEELLAYARERGTVTLDMETISRQSRFRRYHTFIFL